MKKFLIAAGCALTLTTAMAQAETLRIAFDVPYEPFEYKTPDGELTGFEVELAEAMCEVLKRDCEFVVQAWDGMIPGLMARKFDLVMSSMSITDERKQKVLFSKPYYNTPAAWFGAEDLEIDVANKEALKGKIVGVQRGTTMDSYVTEELSGVVKVKRYTTADDMVLDLEGQRLDLVFLDYPVGEQTVLSRDGYAQIGGPVMLGEGVGAAMRQRREDLAEDVNAALDKLKEDGTYDTLMKKYFSYDIKM